MGGVEYDIPGTGQGTWVTWGLHFLALAPGRVASSRCLILLVVLCTGTFTELTECPLASLTPASPMPGSPHLVKRGPLRLLPFW